MADDQFIFAASVGTVTGKNEAVAETIQEIQLSQVADCSIEKFTIVKGALKMPWDWKGWSGSFYPDSVQEKIEAML